MSNTNIQAMVQKLETLNSATLTEINDFIDFLISKKETKELSSIYSNASVQSFNALWDNDEDEVYNEL